jgi:hypothetical protein
MKKNISEELPERKHRQADAKSASNDDKKEGGGKTPEEKIRQAVYDIRYRARREEIPLTQAFSQYMQNSNMSQVEKTAVRKKLAGGGASMEENYNIEDLASDNIAKSLYSVFVEGSTGIKSEIIVSAEELYLEQQIKDRKYKVRVTGKDGRSYVRYATREKINQLRANPNIESVEMTQYGEPYEGEKKKGSLTASVKRSGKLDPVGQEDSDIDNDGDHDKTDKYLLNRRKVRSASIETRKEEVEFIGEVKKSNYNKKIDVMKGKNPVTINPPETKSLMAHNEVEGEVIVETGYSRFLRKVHSLQEKAVSQNQQQLAAMAIEYLDGNMPDASDAVKKMAKMGRKELKKFAKTSHKGLPEKVKEEKESSCGGDKKKEMDPREIPTKVNLVKNKLRAMGLKMSYEPKGEKIDEVLGGQPGDGYIGHPRLGIKNPMSSPKNSSVSAKTAPQNTSIAGKIGNVQSEKERQIQQLLRQSNQIEGELISEREFDEPGEEDWRPDVRAHNKAVGYRGSYRPYKRSYRGPKPGTSGPGSQAKPAD